MAGALVLPVGGFGNGWGAHGQSSERLKIGLIADLHQDIMHDATERVSAFVAAMKAEEGLDFVMQLGDFCVPKEANRGFLEAFNSFEGVKYHVLGNHDVDGGFSWEQTMKFWEMEAPYYTFVKKGIRFVVMDANEKGGERSGYPIFVGAEQVKWFESVLKDSEEPVVVVSHQPFEHERGIENGAELRRIVQASGKVLCCLNGHDHQDYVASHAGTHFLSINSASYVWLGGDAAAKSYPEHIHAAHSAIQYTAPYRDPVWAVLTVDLAGGVIEVRGRQSEWVGDDPWTRGASGSRKKIRPAVSDRRVEIR